MKETRTDPSPVGPIIPQTVEYGNDLAEARQELEFAEKDLRSTSFTYLAVWAYLIVTILSVSHRQLLVGTNILLPILSVGVEIAWFFLLAPLLFLLLHWHVLMLLFAVTQRKWAFAESRAGQENPSESLSQLLLIGSGSVVKIPRLIAWLFRTSNWVVYVGLPLGLFLVFEWRFLPYQDEWITAAHVGIVTADLVLLWAIWPRLAHADGRWWRRSTKASVARVQLAGAASLACLLAALAFFYDQRPWLMSWADRAMPQIIADNLYFRWSKLELRNTTLMRREPDPEIVARLRADAIAGGESEEAGIARAFVDPVYAEPLDLAGRNLRRASLRYVRMYGVRMKDTNLREADLQSAILTEAEMPGANFAGANLSFVQLQHASACANEHTPKEECRWDATKADLSNAEMQGARLTNAALSDAILVATKLDGADLSYADLRRANAKEAQFRGAMLCGAQLQEADLASANLAGADFSAPGASCDSAPPPSAAPPGPCYNSVYANMFRMLIDDKTDFRFSNLSGVIAEPCTQKTTPSGGTAAMGHEADESLHYLPISFANAVRLPEGKVAHVMVDSATSAPLRALLRFNEIDPLVDSQGYRRAITTELAALVCDSKIPAVTQGIIRRAWRASRREKDPKLSYVPCLADAMKACSARGLHWYETRFLIDQAGLFPKAGC